MHALPQPPHPMLLGALLCVLVLVMLLAAAPDLGSLELSVGGAGAEPQAASETLAPTWAEDPMRSPIEHFRR